jgi:Ca2+-binding RTX toxin-like protein
MTDSTAMMDTSADTTTSSSDTSDTASPAAIHVAANDAAATDAAATAPAAAAPVSAAPATGADAAAPATGADTAAHQMGQGGTAATSQTEEGLARLSHIPGSLKDLKGGELEPAAGCPVQTVVRAPEPGEVVTMEVKPGETVQIAFETDTSHMHMVGNDLVIDVPACTTACATDPQAGGEVVLVNYATAQPQLLDVNCDPFIPELAPAAGVNESAGPLFRLLSQGVLPQTDLPFVPISPPPSPPPNGHESPPPPPPEHTAFGVEIHPADPQEGLPLLFQVTTQPHNEAVTITFTAIAGTATPGVDFASSNYLVIFPGDPVMHPMGGPNGTTVTIPAGVTNFFVQIDTFNDNLLEGQETFSLTATVNSPSFDTVSVIPGEGVIEDDQNLSIDISDGTTAPGTEGSPCQFTLTLHGPGNAVVSVNQTITVDLTATSGGPTDTATPGQDYKTGGFEYSVDGGATWIPATGPNGTIVTIPAGHTSILVHVPTIDNTFREGDESFTLTGAVVSAPHYHNVQVDAGNGVIVDNEPGPSAQGRETPLTAANVEAGNPANVIFADNGIHIASHENGKPTEVTMTMTNAQSGDRLSFGNGFSIDNSGALMLNGALTGLTASIAAAAGGLLIVHVEGTAHAGVFDAAMQSLHLTNLDGSLEATGPRGIDVVVEQAGVVSPHLNTDFNLIAPHFDVSMLRGEITTPDYTDPLVGASSKIEGDDNSNVTHGNGGNDFISGGAGDDQIDNVGSGQNVLVGGAGNDTLSGGDGDDKLLGGSGDDLLHGGGGQDWLFGDSGNDTLDGGSGSNTLVGGAGADDMHGSAGQPAGSSDTFMYQNVHEVDADGNKSVDAADVIHDFNGGPNGDTIDISGLLAQLGDPGNVHGTAQVVQDAGNPAHVDVQVNLGGAAGFQNVAVVENSDAATVETHLKTS